HDALPICSRFFLGAPDGLVLTISSSGWPGWSSQCVGVDDTSQPPAQGQGLEWLVQNHHIGCLQRFAQARIAIGGDYGGWDVRIVLAASATHVRAGEALVVWVIDKYRSGCTWSSSLIHHS